jgi:hypothetical protein
MGKSVGHNVSGVLLSNITEIEYNCPIINVDWLVVPLQEYLA